MNLLSRKEWIDRACDKLKEERVKSDKFDLERKENLASLIDTGLFLSAIFSEMDEKSNTVRPDALKQAEDLFKEFESIVKDIGVSL